MTDFSVLRERASRSALLHWLSDEQAADIFSSGREKTFKKGEVILEQGQAGESAALILSGAVKVAAVSATGREIVFAYLSVGEMVGEISVLDGAERTATAYAAEKTECILVSRSHFLRKIEEEPELSKGIIGFLCARLRATNALLESDRSYQTAARLARGILRLVDEHGSAAQMGSAMSFSVSQSDLGAFVSLARENVSRLVSDWSKAGIIEAKQGRIKVMDREALEEIGDVWE